MEKEAEDVEMENMTIPKTYSLKIKNKIKIERLARKKNMKVSPYLNEIIEGLK